MNKINPKYALVFSLILVAFLNFLMQRKAPCFPSLLGQNFRSQGAVLALEFSSDLSQVRNILYSQDSCRSDAATRIAFFQKSIWWDFGFILAYGSFFSWIIFLLHTGSAKGVLKRLLLLMVFICFLDVLENLGLLDLLQHMLNPEQSKIEIPVAVTYWASYLKWLLLYFLTAYLLYRSVGVKNRKAAGSIAGIYLLFILIFLIEPFAKIPMVGNVVVGMFYLSALVWLWLFLASISIRATRRAGA